MIVGPYLNLKPAKKRREEGGKERKETYGSLQSPNQRKLLLEFDFFSRKFLRIFTFRKANNPKSFHNILLITSPAAIVSVSVSTYLYISLCLLLPLFIEGL